VDWSDNEKQPYVMLYDAEDIVNWRYERINGRIVLTMLMLHETDTTYYATTGDVRPDEYQVVYYDQWRELLLEQDGLGGYFFSSTLWRRKKPKARQVKGLKGTGPAPGAGTSSTDEFVRVDYSIPQRLAKSLQEIPFVFCTTKGPDGRQLPAPPLYGMAKQNLSHYLTSADLENALHVLGMPTPWASGFGTDEGDELYLGSSRAWVTSEQNAKCGFLALTGADIAPLVETLAAKEKRMAELGARMLDPQLGRAGAMPEAYATVALRQTGETSVLMDISLSLTQSFQDLLAWALWWCSPAADRQAAEESVAYTLNTDFLGGMMDPNMVAVLLEAYLQKAISFETLFAKLQDGEIIPPDVTVDEEKKAIQAGDQTLLDQLRGQLAVAQALARPQPQPKPGDAAGAQGGAAQQA
jgi:hypothetical protein